ncbi:MAG: zinc ABC transporter substrate-binding protein [Elusimicrobia bacterium]|nr:zinc ABC transporter substrate-binding protein [Elusimicrobiota bacterium]
MTKLAAAAALLLALSSPAEAAKLRVVATVPELADITRRVGGDLVSVDALARGTEDIHKVVMKPSFVTRLNRADAVVFLGLAVEHSFLPGLLDVARNPAMRPDPDTLNCVGKGCIDCSAGMHVLDKPHTLSRDQGDLHPQGNPHYNISPDNGPRIARNVADGLARVDPEHAGDYERNLQAYLAELEPRLAEWRKWVAPLKGLKAVSYHQDMVYLGDFTGLDFVDTIELKPGVAPTPTHLADLVKTMKERGVGVIIREQQFDMKLPEWLAVQTGAKVAVIGTMANSMPGTETYIKFCETNLRNILKTLGKEPKPS